MTSYLLDWLRFLNEEGLFLWLELYSSRQGLVTSRGRGNFDRKERKCYVLYAGRTVFTGFLTS